LGFQQAEAAIQSCLFLLLIFRELHHLVRFRSKI
jgi:hypothetical protein